MSEPDTPARPARKRFLRFAALVLVSVSVCVACWFGLRRNSGEILNARLSDGTVVEVSGVSYARTNKFVHANLIERVLGNLIPASGWRLGPVSLNRSSPMMLTSVSGEPCLAVEFAAHNAQRTPPTFLGPSGMQRSPRVLFWGDDGMEYQHPIVGGGLRDGRRVVLCKTDTFPRDSEFLSLRVEEWKSSHTEWEPVATFRIRNPAPRLKVQPWPATELPTTITNGPISLTLKKLGVVTPSDRPVFLNYSIENADESAEGWSIASVWARDASGNATLWQHSLQSIPRAGEPQRVDFVPALDPRHVWRLEIVALQSSGFATNQVHRVTIPPGQQPVLPGGSEGLNVSCTWLSADMVILEASHSDTNLAVVIIEMPGRSTDILTQDSGNPACQILRLGKKDANEDIVLDIALVRPRTFTLHAKPERIELQPRPASPSHHDED